MLRVIPLDQRWQVLHFWDTGTDEFLGWYVNLESEKHRHGAIVDAVDWHLDLLISPSLDVTWKDEDEAQAAVGTPYLRPRDLETARETGSRIAANPRALSETIGDWTAFVPPRSWGSLELPVGWADAARGRAGSPGFDAR